MDIITYLRSFRFGPFAIFDFAASFLLVYLLAPTLVRLSRLIGWHTSMRTWMMLVVPISVFAHLMFGTMTPLTKMVMDPHGGWIAKIIVFLMVFAAFRGK